MRVCILHLVLFFFNGVFGIWCLIFDISIFDFDIWQHDSIWHFFLRIRFQVRRYLAERPELFATDAETYANSFEEQEQEATVMILSIIN